MTKQRLSLTIFVGIAVISALLWLYLARHMPLRNFGWFCLLTGAYSALELTLRKYLSERIKKNRRFGIMLEVALGFVFVAAFYWFATYIYPGAR